MALYARLGVVLVNLQVKSNTKPGERQAILSENVKSVEAGEIVAEAVFFNNVIQIFIAASAEVDEN